MKLIIYLTLLLSLNLTYSQNFEIKKIGVAGMNKYFSNQSTSIGMMAAKGTVTINDSIIKIETTNTKIEAPIRLHSKTSEGKVYFSLEDDSDLSKSRYILSIDNFKKGLNKKYTLLVDTVDNFTGKVTSLVYLLEKVN